MPLCKSAKYYNSPAGADARKKKQAYDKKFNARPENVKHRSELNKENRKRGSVKGDGKDLSHTKSGLVYKPQSVNRGSSSDSPGDRRARGKRPKR
jgi:hypothetical protein